MLNEYECERIRRANYLEKKSVPRIAKEEGYCHQAIEKALFDPPRYKCAPRDNVLCCLYQLNEVIPAPQVSEHPDQSARPDPNALRFFPTMNSC